MKTPVSKEEFLNRLLQKYSGTVSLVSEFINMNSRVKVRCSVCRNEWEPLARKIVEESSCGCVKCTFRNQETSLEDFVKSVSEKRNDMHDYEIVEYTNRSTLMKVIHTKCSHTYTILPSNFARGSVCPMCCKRPTVSNERFLKRVKDVHGNEYVVIDEYQGSHKKLRIQHTTCGTIFEKTPVNFLKPQGCPFCKQREMESKGEKAVREWLEANSISYKQNFSFEDDPDFKNKKLFSFDFCIERNGQIMLIEYFGELHYRKFNEHSQDKFDSQKNRDELKVHLCQKKNIPLLIIPYTEINSIPSIMEKFVNG